MARLSNFNWYELTLYYLNLKWDAAGDPRFENITSTYYKYASITTFGLVIRGAHAVMMVYDITSERSYNAIEKIMKDIEK